jgi:N-carbamoylputrescine amidase
VPFIEQAAMAGAQLVVLPELFASGYIPNASLWDAAEPQDGLTVTWLKEISRRLDIYLGAGLVESDGKDFLNVFVLKNPEGQVAGRAQKANAEAYCFKRGGGAHIISTSLGKIGVGICADNHFTRLIQLMQDESVDLMLMPHAWPTPSKTGGAVSEQDIRDQHAKVKQTPRLYAELLGVPAMLVNQVGTMGRMSGILGKMMSPEVFRLEGGSQIVDSDGTVKGELGSEEGVLVAEVTLNPQLKRHTQAKSYGGWIDPGSAIARQVFIPLDIALGMLSYAFSSSRRTKARELFVHSTP